MRGIPATERVAAHLREELLRGALCDPLPGVHALTAELGANHNSVASPRTSSSMTPRPTRPARASATAFSSTWATHRKTKGPDKRPRSHSLRSGYAIEQGCGEIGRPEAGAEHQRSGRTDRDGAGRAVDGGGRCKAGHTGGQSQPAGGSDVVSGEDKGASPGLCHLEAGASIRLVVIAGRRWNPHC